MTTPRTLLIIGAGLAMVSQTIGCGRPASEAAGKGSSKAARAAGANSCAYTPQYTVLQLGNTPTGDQKKVTNNCWWQFPVDPVHGYVDEPLGWQLCNACDVDIEFELKMLPGLALTGCNTFIDASNSAHEMVKSAGIKSSGIKIVDCRGLQPVHDSYGAGARLNGEKTPFVSDDPEIEIEDRPVAPGASLAQARLAQTGGLSPCIAAPPATGPRRLTISGQFTRMSRSSAVVFVPTGPGLHSATWGWDLVEIGPREAQAPAASDTSRSFAFSVDLPSSVTGFVLRDSAGKKDFAGLGELPPCR